jgi:hypothetical protein
MPVTPNPPVIKRREYSRWYDSRPPVNRSLSLIVKFPEPLQAPIAEGTIFIADKRFKAEKKMQNLKSLGSKQVMALYKTDKKQRQTDKCPHLFRLCRYLMILPQEKGDDLSEKMTRLMYLIGRYIRHCQAQSQGTDVSVAKELITVFTTKSEHAAKTILTELEHTAETRLETLQTYKALTAIFSEDRLVVSDF